MPGLIRQSGHSQGSCTFGNSPECTWTASWPYTADSPDTNPVTSCEAQLRQEKSTKPSQLPRVPVMHEITQNTNHSRSKEMKTGEGDEGYSLISSRC